MNSNKIYFPNLNGIRFIAALMVIIHHIEQLKGVFNLPTLYGGSVPLSKVILIFGSQGVNLFFVLSGFLITYLLIAEEASTNSINVRNFYLRRMLRIWPLYFLIVIVSLFVLNHFDIFLWPGSVKHAIHENIFLILVLYFLFFANLVLTFFGVVPYASQTWSIGTEEQFYLIWPVVLKYVRQYRLLLMVSIVIFYYLVRFCLSTTFFDFIPKKVVFRAFWNGFTIDCMAIDGFFAVILFQKHTVLKWFLNNYIFYLSISAIIVSYSMGLHINHFNSIYYSGLYGIILLNFAAGKHIHISLENQVFNYLGNISYGLYMFHPIGIILAIRLSMRLNIITNWLIYPFAILFTIALSSISYRWYESYFLKLKTRFAIVKSGSEE